MQLKSTSVYCLIIYRLIILAFRNIWDTKELSIDTFTWQTKRIIHCSFATHFGGNIDALFSHDSLALKQLCKRRHNKLMTQILLLLELFSPHKQVHHVGSNERLFQTSNSNWVKHWCRHLCHCFTHVDPIPISHERHTTPSTFCSTWI